MLVLDTNVTNVVSELMRPRPDPRVMEIMSPWA